MTARKDVNIVVEHHKPRTMLSDMKSIARFNSKANARSFALRAEGMNLLYTNGTQFFVAMGSEGIRSAKAAKLSPLSLLGSN